MLYADKAALENRTKLRLLAIRERELTLYTQNCFTIGTVSALMAGLAYSSLLYTKMDYFQDATPFVQTMYLLGNVVRRTAAALLVVVRLLVLREVRAPHRLLVFSGFNGILDFDMLPSLSLPILEPLDVGEGGALPVD